WDNVASLDPSAVRWLLKGCMGAFALAVVWWCRTPTRPRQGWRLSAEFALVVLGMLLFCERTWKHHCVTLLLPFAVLCYYLATCRPGRKLQVYLIGTFAAVELLMALTSTSLLQKELAKAAQVYGAYVWAYLLLLTALFVVLRRPESGGETSPQCSFIPAGVAYNGHAEGRTGVSDLPKT